MQHKKTATKPVTCSMAVFTYMMKCYTYGKFIQLFLLNCTKFMYYKLLKVAILIFFYLKFVFRISFVTFTLIFPFGYPHHIYLSSASIISNVRLSCVMVSPTSGISSNSLGMNPARLSSSSGMFVLNVVFRKWSGILMSHIISSRVCFF